MFVILRDAQDARGGRTRSVRARYGAQQGRADPPMAGRVVADRRGLAIEPHNVALQRPAVVGCELDAHADRQLGKVDELPSGSNQPQVLDDATVEVEELDFGEPREIDRHDRRYLTNCRRATGSRWRKTRPCVCGRVELWSCGECQAFPRAYDTGELVGHSEGRCEAVSKGCAASR